MQIYKKIILETVKGEAIEVTNSNISPLKTYYFGAKIVFFQIIDVKNFIIIPEDNRLFLVAFIIKENSIKDKNVNI